MGAVRRAACSGVLQNLGTSSSRGAGVGLRCVAVRNPDLSCSLPPRGLVQTSVSSSVLELHTLLALGSVPQSSVLEREMQKGMWDTGGKSVLAFPQHLWHVNP